MAKASKKRGKKAAKRAKKKPKARKSAKKSVKRAPAKRRGAKRKPARRNPARRKKPAKPAPKPPAEPWPMIFVVLLAMAAVLIAAWHFNGAAEAAATFGSLSLPGVEQAALPFYAVDECHPVGAWLASVSAPSAPTFR